MTSRPPAQCASCLRWQPAIDTVGDEQTCAAFPRGIPDDIWWNRADHRRPYAGDNGIRWTPLGSAQFPDYAVSKD